jgi:anthranilate synthase component 1
MFYLPIDDVVVLGASPEKLVSVHEGMITTHPIAGTRRRPDAHHNQAIEADLLSDEKELAEHRMLVDLARNDVGAVATPGSVEVTELLKVKHYAHVSHITSTVIGQLRPECDALDALAAAFPAGTLSGAPKIRAMEIIDKLEVSSRGLYGGAICRLDYQGNLDSCIAIRMAILKNGMALIRAGAGIVFDSDAQAECDETRHKAHAMLYALALAQGVVS